MSKSKSKGNSDKKGKDWTSKLQEVILSGQDAQHVVIPLDGGSDNGEFPVVGQKLKSFKVVLKSGKLHEGDIIVEVQGQKVAGYTQLDVSQWIAQVSKNGTPIMIKTVKPSLLPKDLRQYLNTRFTKGSEDHNLQQTIRDNLYLRTVPCTSRTPRQGEINGVDYTFLSIEDFRALEAKGELLESGEYDGNLYGTPRPPKPVLSPQPGQGSGSSLGSPAGLVPGSRGPSVDEDDPHVSRLSLADASPIHGSGDSMHPSSEGKRRRNRSNVEAINPSAETPVNDVVEHDASTPARPSSAEGVVDASSHQQQALHSPPEEEGDRGPDGLGPLPANWEIATTPDGQVYFIDHNNDRTHWEDPRQSMPMPPSGDGGNVVDLEQLPYGWERVDDPRFGVYYIDHVNRRTQYEHPSLTCNENPATQDGDLEEGGDLKRDDRLGSGISKKSQTTVSSSGGHSAPHSDLGSFSGNSLTAAPAGGIGSGEPRDVSLTRSFFTRDPRELRGDFLRTALTKGSRGFGFTIIGGDDEHEEFLQIKAVVPDGVADKDGKLATGDVIVYINGRCVLGHTHQDVVTLFQSMNIGDVVHIEVVRGYPMPYDPDDPNTEIVTTSAVNKDHLQLHSLHLNHSSATLTPSGNGGSGRASPLRPSSATGGSNTQLHQQQQPPHPPPEIIVVNITKGNMGFGFTIADSIYGQKVKQILDRTRCQNLYEGDILLGINETNVKDADHNGVVNALKECPVGVPTTIAVLRGAALPPSVLAAAAAKTGGAGANNSMGRPKSGLSDGGDGDNRPPTVEVAGNSDAVDGQRGIHHHPPLSGQTSSASQPPPGYEYLSQQQQQQFGGPLSYAAAVAGEPPHTPRDPGPEPYSNTPGGQQQQPPYHHPSQQQPPSSSQPSQTVSAADPSTNVFFRAKTPTSSSTSINAASKSTPAFPATSLHNTVTPNFIPASAYTYNESPINVVVDDNSNKIPPASSSVPTDRLDAAPNNILLSQTRKLPPGVPAGAIQVLPHLSPNNSQTPDANASLANQPTPAFHITQVFLKREESGFGFRIVGGTEEGSQVAIGYVVPGGVADTSGLLHTGDEIMTVDGIDVIGASHHRVVQLMQNAAMNGRVNLGIRRMMPTSGASEGGMPPSTSDGLASLGGTGSITTTANAVNPYPYDVTVERQESEGFGFVIVSSVAKKGLTIGRIIEASPAERCTLLHVGDRIVAVNGIPIDNMHHEEIIKQIKDSGYVVTLTIGAPQDLAEEATAGASPAQPPQDVNPVASSSGIPQRPLLQPPRSHAATNGNPDRNAFQGDLYPVSKPQYPVEQTDEAGNAYLSIELHRGNRGFGFSIRGGQEFNNMPLFVLRMADDGAAKLDGRLSVGDQIIEINGVTTHLMTHAQAIDIIKHGGQTVKLLVKRHAFMRTPNGSVSSASTLPTVSTGSLVNGYPPQHQPGNQYSGSNIYAQGPGAAQGMMNQPLRSAYGSGGGGIGGAQMSNPANSLAFNNHNNPPLRYGGGDKGDASRQNYGGGGGGGPSNVGGIQSYG